MIIADFQTNAHELLIERHSTRAKRFVSWERPNAREFILDIGKFSCAYTNKKPQGKHPHRLSIVTRFIIALLIFEGAVYGGAAVAEFTGGVDPRTIFPRW